MGFGGSRRAQCRPWGGAGVLWSSRTGPWLLDSSPGHSCAGPGAPCLIAEMLKARTKLAVGFWPAAGKDQLVADMYFIFLLATSLGEGAASPLFSSVSCGSLPWHSAPTGHGLEDALCKPSLPCSCKTKLPLHIPSTSWHGASCLHPALTADAAAQHLGEYIHEGVNI